MIERVPTWANGYDRVHVAPRGNSVAGQYVSFELAYLAALVGLSVEDYGVRGVSKLHFPRGRSGSARHQHWWGMEPLHFPRSQNPHIGNWVDVRGADWVHSGAGGTPELSTGIEGNGLGLGEKFGGWVSAVLARAAGGHEGGVSSVRNVAVGLKPVDNAVLKIFLIGHPSDLLESEVDFAVIQGDVFDNLGDLGSSVGHFAVEIVIVATSVSPVLSDEGDEDFVVVIFFNVVFVKVGGKHVEARVRMGVL